MNEINEELADGCGDGCNEQLKHDQGTCRHTGSSATLLGVYFLMQINMYVYVNIW